MVDATVSKTVVLTDVSVRLRPSALLPRPIRETAIQVDRLAMNDDFPVVVLRDTSLLPETHTPSIPQSHTRDRVVPLGVA